MVGYQPKRDVLLLRMQWGTNQKYKAEALETSCTNANGCKDCHTKACRADQGQPGVAAAKEGGPNR